ncbi:helix-turn-helix transcriptional regulator [Microbacterium telephonicum]|uniref:Helix-turn-helix protein n=2 Tax=Microbacterium TaxID=33882 RepID=A0A498CAF3_9MICO|nr:helix-turn-helix domain-containing protein [Microbacterium telephonicum]RLK52483.1 helix-turn-helix protein [Microbacterium telephonicum]
MATHTETREEIEWLSPQDVADMLPGGITVGKLERWRREGGGPVFHKLGKTVAYIRSEVDQWIRDTACRSTSDTWSRSRSRR